MRLMFRWSFSTLAGTACWLTKRHRKRMNALRGRGMCPAGCLRACDFFLGAAEAMWSSVERMESGESGGSGRYGGSDGESGAGTAGTGVGCASSSVPVSCAVGAGGSGSGREKASVPFGGGGSVRGEEERESAGDEDAGEPARGGGAGLEGGNLYSPGPSAGSPCAVILVSPATI